MSLAPGTQLDRYVVEAVLGSGGMGTVYRAHDPRLERTVALKVLDPREGDVEGAVAAAFREARAAGALHHAHVAAIYDVAEMGDRAFIVMEYVPGASLRAFVGDASVEMPTRLRWLADIAGALAAAHALGVIHRDVKPENVMVSDTGGVKVLDFGVARAPRRGASAEGTPPEDELRTLSDLGSLLGTPAYMAPEQIRGEVVDGRADQFGWAVLAYELLTGALPWRRDGQRFNLLLAILRDVPEPFSPASGVPAEVSAAILRALSKSPASRFDSMFEVVAALAPYAARSPSANPSGRPSAGSSAPPSAGPSVRPSAGPSAPPSAGSSAPPSAGPSVPPSAPPSARPSVRPSAPPSARPSAPRSPLPPSVTSDQDADLRPPTPVPPGSPFRDPDFAAPVDLQAHLALLPPGATGKGMYFNALLAAGARARPGLDLCALAGITARRYIPFRDYPMDEYLRLEVATAAAVHRGVPIGEGLRRLGWTALDSLLGSHVGKMVFGVLGRDADLILLNSPKGYQLTLSFGLLTVEKDGPRRYLVHASGLPIFLETYHVGVFEGGLRHCGARGRVRIATEGLEDATFEVTLL